MQETNLPAVRTAKGRFPKGVSGNPGGRPKSGAPTALQLIRKLSKESLEEEIHKEALAVVKVVVKAAKAGDMVAAKMLLDRVLPAPRGLDPASTKALGGIQIVIQGTAEVANTPIIEGEFESED
jgi:hypothetical protein